MLDRRKETKTGAQVPTCNLNNKLRSGKGKQTTPSRRFCMHLITVLILMIEYNFGVPGKLQIFFLRLRKQKIVVRFETQKKKE